MKVDKEAPILFQEQDGVWLYIQVKDRPKGKKVEIRILNGDGTNWIKVTCEEQDIHFQLDSFHISQAIMRKVNDKKAQKQLLKLFRENKIYAGLETIENMMLIKDDNDSSFKKYRFILINL